MIYGNYEDKYKTKNPISKLLVSNFFRAFERNLHSISAESISTICEVGCAEGELLKTIHSIIPDAALYACDLSEEEINKAKQNCTSIPIQYSIQNAEQLEEYSDSLFDLVICCEVLEHLSNPLLGLQELFRISKRYILVSVPNEPIWRVLNIARGKYIRALGNTPGHLNHWNVLQFPRFLLNQPNYSIIKKNYPLPWQMVLLKKISTEPS
jgi:2-polyprenyl-3-methyl-5-hydroxy-6-metoxy-1,4-benzoquinol methylase